MSQSSTARPRRVSAVPAARAPHRTRRAGLAAVLAVLASLLALAVAQPSPDDPDAILERIVDNMRGGGQRATMTLTVERPDRSTEYVLETISDGAERALTRVVAPSRDAGQAFLSLENELFVYTPRLGRVLRLPPSGRSDGFLGSDISYSDLAGDDVRDDYDATIASRTDDEIVLSLVPRPGAPTPYGELRFRASWPELAPLELVFADQRGADVKRIVFEEVRELDDGRLFPTRLVVEDLLEEGNRTVAVWSDAEFDVAPPESCFTQRALERGCP